MGKVAGSGGDEAHSRGAGKPTLKLTLHKFNRDLQQTILQASSNFSVLDALIDEAFTTLRLKR